MGRKRGAKRWSILLGMADPEANGNHWGRTSNNAVVDPTRGCEQKQISCGKGWDDSAKKVKGEKLQERNL